MPREGSLATLGLRCSACGELPPIAGADHSADGRCHDCQYEGSGYDASVTDTAQVEGKANLAN